ncbi:MAG: tetratricopeptide repeat protein [Nitrospira sp.]|nr:tetratricopeptide repeat protein [Nitrospira sp.]
MKKGVKFMDMKFNIDDDVDQDPKSREEMEAFWETCVKGAEEFLERYPRGIIGEIGNLEPRKKYEAAIKGYTYYVFQEYSKSLEAFNEALTYDPDEQDCLRYKGTISLLLDRFSDAVDAYDHLLRINPSDVYTWTYRGIALKYLGEFEQARDSFDQALKYDPSYATAIKEKRSVEKYFLSDNDDL